VLRIFIFRPEKSDGFGAGLNPANLGTKGQHATSRPPEAAKGCCYMELKENYLNGKYKSE
jgi:hypothetical protein